MPAIEKHFEIKYSENANTAMSQAMLLAAKRHHEYITPEHLLMALTSDDIIIRAFIRIGVDVNEIRRDLETALGKYEKLKKTCLPEVSMQFQEVVTSCIIPIAKGETGIVTVRYFIEAIMRLENSFAAVLLINSINNDRQAFIEAINDISNEPKEPGHALPEEDLEDLFKSIKNKEVSLSAQVKKIKAVATDDGEIEIDEEEIENFIMNKSTVRDRERERYRQRRSKYGSTLKEVVLTKEIAGNITPRTDITDRIFCILSRMKNNCVIVVGDRGVGKSYLKYCMINEIATKMPTRFKDCSVYEYDINTAGCLGPFQSNNDERINSFVKDLASEHKKAIVFVDDIHLSISSNPNIESLSDMSKVLRPIIESNNAYLVCTINQEDFIRNGAHISTLMRHFQQLNMGEPNAEDAEKMIRASAEAIRKHHHVKIDDSAIQAVMDLTKRYNKTIKSPSNAIDMLDEACGVVHFMKNKRVLKDVDVANTMSFKYGVKSIANKPIEELNDLAQRLKERIYGQDNAIDTVVNAIHVWRAGLNDDEKPIASMLFVGPTGVGKTEIARALASELGTNLVRFDMSEYAEKHTVSKFLGSPAGYVGYEDGGLLTTAIMKSPNCVLLLDEIEKAHPDIYNVLLQVLDYGCLTDSRGQKANFQNVFIILTSNAGAQYAKMASMGFASTQTEGTSMLSEVKKVFKPEFLNRLTSTIVFNSMDMTMARMILDKKLREFSEKLSDKKIEMTISEAAHEWMLHKGFTKEYGAREMDRVVGNSLKPLFVHEIVFGDLKKGGKAFVDVAEDNLFITVEKETIEKTATKKTSKKKEE